MAVDIGPRIGIEGEREYRQKLQEIIAGQKTLASEAKAVSAAMQDETNAEKKDAAQKDVLTRQILNQKEKLEELEKGLRASARLHGEASVTTQKWQQAVYEAQATLSNMERELRGTDSQVEEISDDMRDAGQSAAGWADVMKGSLLADAVKSGLNWMKDTVQKIGSKIRDASEAGAAYADEMLTISTVSGIGTEELQAYAYMADLVDVSLDTVTGSMSKMTKSMASAVKGKGAAAEAWKKLNTGITNADGSMRKADDVFRDTLDALRKIENPTERDALAMEIFGRSAQELNPLISAGADRLEELRKEAKDAGAVLSGPALQALGKQQDAMDRLDRKTEALSNRFASRLAPGVEKAVGELDKMLDSPVIQRGLDNMAETVSGVLESAASLAADVLPGVFRALTTDPALKYLSDETLALMKATDDAKDKYDGLMDRYKDSAGDILDEQARIEGLWKELQELTDWSGRVKLSDQERADYILGELNDALGTEYTRNGEIIEQYQDMQKEIGNLIQKKTAASMIDMFNETYAESEKDAKQLLQNAADLRQKMYEARDAWQESVTSLTGANQEEMEKAYLEAKREYEEAQNLAGIAFDNIRRYGDAQVAFAQGNYKEVIALLGDETQATIEYYKNKEKLTAEDKVKFLKAIQDMEAGIVEYKIAMDQGLRGYSTEGLKELEDYAANARRILNGEEIATSYMDGLRRGLTAKQKLAELQAASQQSANVIVSATRGTLEINSPSRVGEWCGEMWPAGLVKGMRKREAELRRTAAGLSASVIGAGSLSASVGQYGGALAAPIGTLGGSLGGSSHTTNVGGVTIQIPGAQGVNEDVLAQRVAVRLTQEINRANRARGG